MATFEEISDGNNVLDLFTVSLGGDAEINYTDYSYEAAQSFSIDFVPPLMGTELLQNEVANILGGVEKCFND